MKKAIFLMGLVFFAVSCKKTVIKQSNQQTSSEETSKEGVKEEDMKFSKVVTLKAGDFGSGSVNLTVKSNEEEYLETYCRQFENTTLNMVPQDKDKDIEERNSTNEEPEGYISLDFDWTNYTFKTEDGVLYGVNVQKEDMSKSIVLTSSFGNVWNVTSSIGFAAVNVYNTYRKPWWTGSGRNNNTAYWSYTYGQNPWTTFYTSNYVNRYAYVRVRAFNTPSASTDPNFGTALSNSLPIFQESQHVYRRYRTNFLYAFPGYQSITDKNTITRAEGRRWDTGGAPGSVYLYFVG